jgi:hypothetical protein
MSANAAGDAAQMSSDASRYSAELQMMYLREVRADIADAVAAGLIDLDTGFNAAIKEMQGLVDPTALNEYKNLLEDPNAIMDRPTTQYQYEQGVEALQAAYSKSSGGGVSGQSLKAATEYGQNFAAMKLDQELARLKPLIDIDVGARTNISNLQQAKGSSKASLRLGGATGEGQAVSSMVPSIATSIQAGGDAQAAGAINQGNTWSNFASQMALLTGYLGKNAANEGLFTS